jgi:Zn-finger protein
MSVLLETDFRFQKFILNECIDFRLACNAYGIKINASKSGVCFCPFHYNKNTPSAKVYESGLYCFSENRSYNVSDLFDCFLVEDTIQNAFNNIWEIIDDDKKSELKSKYEKINNGVFYKGLRKDFLPLLDYKKNKIDYTEYCDRLYAVLQSMTERENEWY